LDELFEAFSHNKAPFFAQYLSLALSLVYGIVLRFYYLRFSTALSSRVHVANMLPLLTAVTCVVITVVKSSLALSLGLVGALSIVRFRTPIKEPEELTYIFLAVAVGLGLAANQYLFVTVGLALILVANAIDKARFRPPGRFLNTQVMIPLSDTQTAEQAMKAVDIVYNTLGSGTVERMELDDRNLTLVIAVQESETQPLTDLFSALREKYPGVICSYHDARPMW
jgi:hypothetical protein